MVRHVLLAVGLAVLFLMPYDGPFVVMVEGGTDLRPPAGRQLPPGFCVPRWASS